MNTSTSPSCIAAIAAVMHEYTWAFNARVIASNVVCPVYSTLSCSDKPGTIVAAADKRGDVVEFWVGIDGIVLLPEDN